MVDKKKTFGKISEGLFLWRDFFLRSACNFFSDMLYRLLADLIVLVHLLFIIFALLGGLFCLRRKWYALIHVPAAVWAVLIEFRGWFCPLTSLENRLRRMGDAAGYEGGFIEHYLLPILSPPGLTPAIQYFLGAMALAANIGVYLFVFRQNSGGR